MQWSPSKLQALRQCHRKYYFQYILADHGFKNPIRRIAYELSKSQNLKMWQGSLIDWAVTELIIPAYQSKSAPDFEEIAERVISVAETQFEFSQNREYHIKGNSKNKLKEDYQILNYHVWGREYDEKDVEAVYRTVWDTIIAFPNSESPEAGRNLHDYLLSSSFIKANEDWWAYTFCDIELNPQIDLIRYKGKSVHVIDWKVSDSAVADYTKQLVIGGIVSLNNIQKDYKERGWSGAPKLADVQLFHVNLLAGKVQKYVFDKEVVAATLDRIYLDTQHEKTGEQVKWHDVTAEEFDITDKPETCAMCKFRPLCTHLMQNNYEYDEQRYTELVQVAELA